MRVSDVFPGRRAAPPTRQDIARGPTIPILFLEKTILCRYHRPEETMDFKHFQQFLTLAETLNLRRAAEKLHMAQPPLSVSIRKLEAEVGVTLFTRGKDGVKLTASGEAALAEARHAPFHAAPFHTEGRP